MHRTTYSEICEWILNSWDKVLDDMIKKVFQKSEIIDMEQNTAMEYPQALMWSVMIVILLMNWIELQTQILKNICHLNCCIYSLFYSDTESEDFFRFSDMVN